MSRLHAWVERMWWSEDLPPLWLRALEPIYSFISKRNLEKRTAHMISPSLPMISIGNITAGGSGKTPFVIWLAHQLKAADHAPVILCRGDGGTSSSPEIVATHDDPKSVGDEALLLAQQSGCPVVAGRDRITGAQLAAKLGDILLLDDGFQYRQLGRCCDIVLVPSEGVGNSHLIPAGPLREPVRALERADIIIRSGAHECRPLSGKREWRWQAKAGSLQDMLQLQKDAPEQVLAVTGIARPHRFFDDLQASGIDIVTKKTFTDHYQFTASDVKSFLMKDLPVAVTAKDAVKLMPLWPEDVPLWVLPQTGIGDAGLFDAILQHITSD